MGFEELKIEAPKLGAESLAALAHERLTSFDTLPESEMERLWVEAALRRNEDVDRGLATPIPAEEVFKKPRAWLA